MKHLLLTTIAAVLLVGVVSVIAESGPKVLLMHTPDGIEFGIWADRMAADWIFQEIGPDQ